MYSRLVAPGDGLDPDLEPLGDPFRSVFGILVGLQAESKLGRRLVS
jgi:hypothetical protein